MNSSKSEGWKKVRDAFSDQDIGKSEARKEASEKLFAEFFFRTHEESGVLYVYRKGVYRPKGEQIVHERLEEKLGEVINKTDVNEIIEKIKSQTYTPSSEFNPDEKFINLKNGVYNIETSELEDHKPGFYFINQLPVEYDAEAECPEIKKFLRDILKEDDLTKVQELIGLCLYRDYYISRAFMLHGKGSNGKSVFINLMRNLLGAKNVSSIPLQELSGRFNTAELNGKLANMDSDIPPNPLTDSSIFKKLTGDDYLKGERKYENPFQFKNYATLIFAANKVPEPSENTDGFFRRWVILDFPYKFTSKDGDGFKDKDPEKLQKITTDEELKGLLNWALEGLERILETGQLSKELSPEEKRQRYLEYGDPIGKFMEDHVEVDLDGFVSFRVLEYILGQFCEEYNRPKPNIRKINKRLKENFSLEERKKTLYGSQWRCWQGIRITGYELDEENNIQHIKEFHNSEHNDNSDW